MKRLLTTPVILTGLLGSAESVWADAESDTNKGDTAYKASDYAEAVKWYRLAAEQGHAVGQNNLNALGANDSASSARAATERQVAEAKRKEEQRIAATTFNVSTRSRRLTC